MTFGRPPGSTRTNAPRGFDDLGVIPGVVGQHGAKNCWIAMMWLHVPIMWVSKV